MRKLMWLAIGFAIACIVGVYLVFGNWLLLLFGVALTASIPLFLLKTKNSRVTAFALLGCALGFLWLWGYHTLYLNTLKPYDGQTLYTTVEVRDYSFETSYGCAADGRITLEGKTYKVRIYLPESEAVAPGDQIEGKLRLRMTIAGGKQPATHHQGDGIFLLGYFDEDATIQNAAEFPKGCLPAKWRHDILSRIAQLFPETTKSFAKALLLGDTHDLTYEQDTAFKLSGIRHVVAVSGLHVAILFSFVYMVTGKQRYLTALIGIPVLILFAAAAGFTPSVVRACVMQGLIILAMIFDKEYDPPTALAAAALTMLLVNPITITSVSFQLSVGCMVGIFLFYRRIHDYILRGKRKEKAKGNSLRAKILRWCVNTVSITLSAGIVTTPLVAWYFDMVSLIGILTNLLTMWLISFIFYGIMLCLGLSFVWAAGASVVAKIVSVPIAYVTGVAELLSRIPLSAVYTCSIYIVIWLAVAYGLFFIMLYSKKRKPLRSILAILIALALCVSASYIEPRLDDYRITVFDVGQGQCVLFQSKGETWVVDCGGDSGDNAAETVAQYLLSQGITHLNGLFLTHYDRDHANGALQLLSRIYVETLYLPNMEDTGTIRLELEKNYSQRICWVEEKTVLSDNRFTITMYPALGKEDKNENSMCLLFQRGNYDILITGDRNITGERELLSRESLPKLELLILGHHGAADSTSLDLLEATVPTAVVISVGNGNFFGHPAQETLLRLSLYQTKIYRTDIHGTIIFRG